MELLQLAELFYPPYFLKLASDHVLWSRVKWKNVLHASPVKYRKYFTHNFLAQKQIGETKWYRILDWRLYKSFELPIYSTETRPYFLKPSKVKTSLSARSEKQRNCFMQFSFSKSRSGEQKMLTVSVQASCFYSKLKLDLILQNPVKITLHASSEHATAS